MKIKSFKKLLLIPLVIIVLGIVFGLVMGGMNLGTDFAGGTLINLDLGTEFDAEQVRQQVEGTAEVTGPVSVTVGEDDGSIAILRIQQKAGTASGEELANAIVAKLTGTWAGTKLEFTGTVGGTTGFPVITHTLLSLAIALAAMFVYVWIRFGLRFGISALLALLCNVLLMGALLMLLQIPVNASVIAACLVSIGLTIYLAVVAFDRVRENMEGYSPQQRTREELAQTSIQETRKRAVAISAAMLLLTIALYFLGTQPVKMFVLPVAVGVLTAFYSAMVLSVPIWFHLEEKSSEKKKQKSKTIR